MAHSTPTCHELECYNEATCCARIETADENTGLDGFTVLACDEHSWLIKEATEHLCRGEEVAVKLMSLVEYY